MSVTEPEHPRNVSLTDVAQAAGLSRSAVSYALRGNPKIPAATAARVQQLADELGYKPDLRIKSLMTAIRQRKALRRREPLAFAWLRTPRQKDRLAPHVLHFSEAVRRGAHRRAEELGCAVEEFWLDDGDMQAGRLNQILHARGIAGCVLCTAASNEPVRLEWDWSSLATAIVGHTEFSPPIHRAAHHHFLSVCSVLRRLADEGWRRPAAILSRTVQDRIHRAQHAAFLANHPSPEEAPALVRFSLPASFGELEPWAADLAPDVLIVGWQLDALAVAVLQAKVPTARRIVTLDWYPHGVLPGVDPVNDDLAAKAVDLVVDQLHRNDYGLPARPTMMLREGVWRESW